MLRSQDRILTTHVGSLPRSQAVTDVLFARENNGPLPPDPDKVIADAVADIVARQVEVGIDVVSDGEMGKISYATYIKDRLSGFDGDTPEVRSFAPHEGTPEDPVCGSGNGAVAYYLRQRRGAIDYRARQGRCVGRDGHIHVAHEGGTIWLGGQAINCIEGHIVA